MRICLVCENVYHDDTPYGECPMRECYGEVIEIDENLYEVCQCLNWKGYITKNSCSAHSFSQLPQTYIQFCGKVKFPKLPAGFKAETMRLGEEKIVTCIRKHYNSNLSSAELQRQIWKTARTLLDWAEQVPLCEDFE